MLRQPFDRQQRRLQDKLLVFGSQIEDLLRQSVTALEQGNHCQTELFFEEISRLTPAGMILETETMALLSTQQPMAGDLRFLVSVLEISLELGRIIHHTAEINRFSLRLESPGQPELLQPLQPLAAAVGAIYHNALEALAKQDVNLARSVAAQDDEVDDRYRQFNRQVLVLMKNRPNLTSSAIYLSQIAHQLERIADRVTNLCEWVVYAVTGQLTDINIPQDERIQADYAPDNF